MRINWKVRLRNKNFWFSFIPAMIVLVQAVASLFGFTLNLDGVADKLLDIVNTVFIIMTLLGVVNDPTTATYSDSNLAMTYEKPREDDQKWLS